MKIIHKRFYPCDDNQGVETYSAVIRTDDYFANFITSAVTALTAANQDGNYPLLTQVRPFAAEYTFTGNVTAVSAELEKVLTEDVKKVILRITPSGISWLLDLGISGDISSIEETIEDFCDDLDTQPIIDVTIQAVSKHSMSEQGGRLNVVTGEVFLDDSDYEMPDPETHELRIETNKEDDLLEFGRLPGTERYFVKPGDWFPYGASIRFNLAREATQP